MVPDASAPRPRTVTWFGVIAVAGFAIRLAYVLQSQSADPLFYSPQMDALYHHRWALAVAAGMEFIRDAFFRAPLYPYFLGLLYRVTGADLLWIRIIQAVVGSLSCGLTFLLARWMLGGWRRTGLRMSERGERTARAAGFVMAAYPLAVYFEAELLIPVLLLFLLMLGLVLLYRSLDQDRQWYLPGLVFGMAAITRPNALVFLALLPMWFFLTYRRQAWRRLLVLLGAAALMILPVTVRNYVVGRQLVPISWQGGTNFFIGNNPESDGVTAIVPGTRGSWWGGYNDVRRLAEEELGRDLTGPEIDRYWLGRGLDFWRSRPGRAVALTLRKLYLLVSGYEVSNNRDIYHFSRYSFLKYLILNLRFLKFPFGLLLPLALLGFWLTRTRSRRFLPAYLFLAGYGLSFVPFFITARYRLPMVPVLAIAAVLGVSGLLRLRRARLAVALSVLVLVFLAVNADAAGAGRAGNPAQNHYTAAVGYHETGRLQAAAAELRQALEYDSAGNVLALQALVLAESGRQAEARSAALAGVRAAPGDAEVRGGAGNVFAALGEIEQAERLFQESVQLDPYLVQSWTNLGNTAVAGQDFGRARDYYMRALAIDPVFVPAHFHLGLVDYYQGRKGEARERWLKVLRLQPNHARALQALDQLR